MKLSPRQDQVLYLISRGRADKEIAVHLSISISTVEYHVGAILKRLRARHRAHAVAIYFCKKQ